MANNELTDLTVAAAARAIAAHELSPVELTRAYLDLIQDLNPDLNAYITITPELALHQARRAEHELTGGRGHSALHGIPFALKDIYLTRGVRTTAGSRLFEHCLPDEDATVYARLREAGGVLLGKLNTHELAFGVTNNNLHFGPARNPWDRSRIPGGSSGGSGVAVAGQMAPYALGTDTGGSIRIPASLCGCVGFKLTYGRVSKAGIVPLSWSLDHAGPLTRTVEDAALVLQALAGADPLDPTTPPVAVPDYAAALRGPIAGMRLAVLRGGFCEALDPDVAAAFEAALDVYRELGARVEDVGQTPELWQARLTYADILLPEARYLHREALREHPEAFGADVLARLNRRTDQTAEELVAAQRQQAAAIAESTSLLERFDALLCPTTRAVAPTIDAEQMMEHLGARSLAAAVLTTNTAPFDVTGMPALSLPCGFTGAGLPIGLQIAGRRWDEATVLRLGHAYEQATPWHQQRPDL